MSPSFFCRDYRKRAKGEIDEDKYEEEGDDEKEAKDEIASVKQNTPPKGVS